MPIRPILPRAALAAALCLAALHAGAATITVTSSADNTTVDGFCTLREAILAVNAAAASADCPATGSGWGTNDTIAFGILGIPAGGVKTIQPASGLPGLVRRVLVDGYTQPGASPNTIAGGNYPNATLLNTQIRIEIDGSAQAVSTHGLTLGASGSVVRGLSIFNFADHAGIRIDAPAVQVNGNFLGWRADGATRGTAANFVGVDVRNANNASIGSASAADRNLIAGSGAGVQAYYANGIVVEGNLFGITKTGAAGGSKTVGRGIYLQELTVASIAQNVIANHDGDGIQLWGAQSALIGGNTIGESVGGAALGNFRGILFTYSNGVAANGNVVYANGITASQFDGIAMWGGNDGTPSANRLDDNTIYANSGLGINFKPASEPPNTVTPNDMPDADGAQNFPVIASAQVNANGSIGIAFTLDTVPNSQFDVSAYANAACDASGHGEGQYRTGGMATVVNTDASGHANGTITVPAPLPPGWGAGAFVALLSHQGGAGTSEFSACGQVAAAPGAGMPPVMGDVPDQTSTVGGAAFGIDLGLYVTPTDGDAVTDYGYTGMLPPGLQLNSGWITGTPTQAGTYTVQVRAGDKDGWSGYDSVQFTIAPAGGTPGNPGGPGGAAAIPTLSEWGRLLAALLVGVLGLAALRAREQKEGRWRAP